MNTAAVAEQGPVGLIDRRQWLHDLIAGNQKLPPGTRIRTTVGGVRTGGFHELPPHVLESANRLPNHMSNDVPFWILGWRDLHDDLLPPDVEATGLPAPGAEKG